MRASAKPARTRGAALRPKSFAWPDGVAILFLAALSLALAATSAQAQIPIQDLPAPTGFVVDKANILSSAAEKKLIAINRELQQKTGAEIAVLTVPTTGDEPPFDYAMAVAEAWKPGSREKDNGVVFLIATDDRKMQILTGYGAEGALPDGLVGEIRDRIVRPAFRAGRFDQGVLTATAEMAHRIAADSGVQLTGEAATRARGRGRQGNPLAVLLVLGLMLTFLIERAFMTRRHMRQRGRSGVGAFLAGTLLGYGLPRRHHGHWGSSGYGSFGGGFGGGGGGFGGFGGGGFGGGGAGGGW